MTTFIEWIFNWNTSTLVLQSTDINIKTNKKNSQKGKQRVRMVFLQTLVAIFELV